MNKNAKQRFDVDPILEKISPHIPDREIDFFRIEILILRVDQGHLKRVSFTGHTY